jgi:hypothetical protein
MNFEQLGTGTLHIGFFVLTAAISGAVAWALAASITPAENSWNRARNRYGEREFGARDNYEWVTKTTIVWSWLRRHISPLEKLYGIWLDAKEQCMVESGGWSEENVPRFHRMATKKMFGILLGQATGWVASLLKRPLGGRVKPEVASAGVAEQAGPEPG